jgi:DNA (cytosine-5)-methyltransferase 1
MPALNCFLKLMSSNYKVASLFCGCGGIDKGLEGGFELPYHDEIIPSLGFEVIWANDYNAKAVESYRANFTGTNHYSICGDIVKIVELARSLRAEQDNDLALNVPLPVGCDFNCHNRFIFPATGDVDLVTGGFPCQPFSLAGKRLALDDPRGKLYQAMLEAVDMLKPAIFLAENVKGIKTAKGDVIKQIEADFDAIGYRLEHDVLVASNFGVPQRRERVIMIGTRKGSPAFDFESIQPVFPQVKLGRAIKHLEHHEDFQLGDEMHIWSKAKKNKGQGNSRCDAQGFAPTMRAEHHGNIEFHYNGERRLSVREAALIQSFPNSFKFRKSATDAYRQIGNAVPPLMAWHIGKAIKQYLDKVKGVE